MCGRYQLVLSWERLVQLYGAEALLPAPPDEMRVYNIAPTQPVAVVVHPGSGTLELSAMRWGFPAPWLARQGKDPFSRSLVNARSEDAHDKGTWRRSLRERRCLVPATGFYEWLRLGKGKGAKKYPVLFTPQQEETLTIAGIWGRFRRGEEEVDCVSLLTTSANATMAPIHDRMPVLLAREQWQDWLDPEAGLEELQSLMKPAPDDWLGVREVSTDLNSWKAERPEVLEANWSLGELGAEGADGEQP